MDGEGDLLKGAQLIQKQTQSVDDAKILVNPIRLPHGDDFLYKSV